MKDEMTFSTMPDWTEMDRINTRTRAFLEDTPLTDSAVDTFTMVISELMENAIKYGRPGYQVDVSVVISPTDIRIRVDNQVNPEHIPNLKNLDQTLQWIRGVHDPYQAFLDRIRELSREPMNEGKSCLGLVRIAYEGRADIDFILEGDRLSVSAIASLNASTRTTETSEDA